MDLELKHLAPYLPYGLKVKDKMNPKADITYQVLSISIENGDGVVVNYNSNNFMFIHEVKPILRPLSDVWNKEYQKQDWAEYIKYDRVKELFVVDTETSTGTMHLKSFVAILDFLYSNHFDVFGLIEQNLAIDINTI